MGIPRFRKYTKHTNNVNSAQKGPQPKLEAFCFGFCAEGADGRTAGA
jgi:hypothetical protein